MTYVCLADTGVDGFLGSVFYLCSHLLHAALEHRMRPPHYEMAVLTTKQAFYNPIMKHPNFVDTFNPVL